METILIYTKKRNHRRILFDLFSFFSKLTYWFYALFIFYYYLYHQQA